MIHEKQIIIFFVCVIAGAAASAATHAIKGLDRPKRIYKNTKEKGVSAIFRI